MRLETDRYITGYIRILLVIDLLRTYTFRNCLIYNWLYTYTTSYIWYITSY